MVNPGIISLVAAEVFSKFEANHSNFLILMPAN